MKTLSPSLQSICLKPGKLFVGDKPCEVMTLLGSCVAVTMFSPRLRVASICHAMLADPDGPDRAAKETAEPYKYVSLVVPFMAEKFRNLGITPTETEVKLFGGANVFGNNHANKRGHGIGVANIRRAKEILDQYGLRVAREHTGGDRGRKLIFNTTSGVVWLKCLRARDTLN